MHNLGTTKHRETKKNVRVELNSNLGLSYLGGALWSNSKNSLETGLECTSKSYKEKPFLFVFKDNKI
jgi:hypothetical protein